MAKIRDGSTYLDKHLCANDYYAEGEKISGQWQGGLAEQLGLAGKAIDAGDMAFRMLRENVNPATGEKLTQRNVEGGVRFFDFQCGAEKSVSVLHALTGDERLAVAHDRAAARAFAELESFAACRVRSGEAAWSNDTRTTGNVCAAVFRHDASRALDPQLHTHFVVANATWDAQKQRMVALTECQMVEAIRYAGKVYQNELAREVQSLGYLVDEKRNAKGMVEGFSIRGVSADVCEKFSRRRAEVEAGIAEFEKAKGRAPSSAEIAVITRQTRNAKLSEISTPEVRAAQLARLSGDERAQLDTLKVAALRRGPVQEAEGSAEGGREADALKVAVGHRFERASVLKGHDVLAEALNVGLGRVRLDRLKVQAQAGAGGLVALGKSDGILSAEFATLRGVALEKWAVGLVNRTKGTCAALVAGNVQVADWLADEQKQAVRFVAGSNDQIMAVRGVAGAGKTTLLKELDAHLQKSSHRLLYLAPTAAAVKVLQSEGFTNATTVSEYLVKASRGAMPAEWRKAVVVVDEAGLQSNRQGADVLGLAEREKQRVVFVGDTRQHSSVEAGDFLRVLEAHSKIASCELKDVRRQTAADYNQAVRLLASGQAAAGMERLDGLGWIKEAAGDYLPQAATEYVRLTAEAKPKESVLCVAPTWAENHVLTGHIREGLRASGKLGEGQSVAVLESLDWTAQQRRAAGNYQVGQMVTFNRELRGTFKKGESLAVDRIEGNKVVLAGGRALDLSKAAFFDVAVRREIDLAAGDKVLLRANDKKAGLVNGDVLTVKSIGADGRIETAEGKTVPASYRQLTHGYVVTSHRSQGRTADKVVVAAAALDCKAAYVACSRGRQSCAVFTPDIRTAAQLAAAEPALLHKGFGVVVERMALELQGVSCLPLETLQAPRKNICVSRSFGRPLEDLENLRSAVATHATRGGEKLRRQRLAASAVHVFLQTNPHRPELPQYFPALGRELLVPTSFTLELVGESLRVLEAIYRPGYRYIKAGVMLLGLVPDEERQTSLFMPVDRERERKQKALMKAADKLNLYFGRGTVRPASTGSRQAWAMRQNYLTPRYTTRIGDIPSATIN